MTQPTTASVDDYRWLIGPEAQGWLETATAWNTPTTSQVARLRQQLSHVQTHLVLEQAALRSKARAKFSAAERMFFAPRALEQATDEIVAAHKARRFDGRAFDLCTGIGGDFVALAARGETVGFDRDPTMQLLAEANLSACADAGLPLGDRSTGASCVRVGDVCQVDLAECVAWHIDPDRRSGGRRTTHIAAYEPATEAIERLLAQNANAGIKLAPAADVGESWAERAELEWISRGRECRQLVAWFGDLAREQGRRRATILGSLGAAPRSIVGAEGRPESVAGAIGRYLYEPDAAVLAAGLDGVLAAEHGLATLTRGAAYWTGDALVVDAALAGFEVREVVSYRIRELKALLAARHIGNLEIKQRGTPIDPAEVRRQLDLRGTESATLVIARLGQRVVAILADRIVAS